MRIGHQVRLFEVVKAYEKSRIGSSLGQDRRLDAIRDEVIISTEAKRQQILGRVLSQVVERLRNLSPSQNPLLDVDAIIEEAAEDLGRTPLDPEEKARIRKASLDELRREGASR